MRTSDVRMVSHQQLYTMRHIGCDHGSHMPALAPFTMQQELVSHRTRVCEMCMAVS